MFMIGERASPTMPSRSAGTVTPGDTHVIVVHMPPGRLTTFRGLGWVALEAYPDEQQARARFHALKSAFEGLKAAAVLMKALVHQDMRIDCVRTIMSKDAEFWRLKDVDIGTASREQVKEWQAAAAELMVPDGAEALARRPLRRKAEPSKGPVWAVAAALAVLVMGIGVAAALRFPTAPPPEASRNNNLFMSDPRDPNFVIEYAVAVDGSRKAVRRLTRDDLQSGAATTPEHTNGTSKPKSLADRINVFLGIRQ